MRQRTWVVLIVLGGMLFTACGGHRRSGRSLESRDMLNEVRQEVQTLLERMDKDIKAAATELESVPLRSPESRAILENLLAKHPYAVDACTISPNGIIVAMEPDAYAGEEGKDISNQEQFKRMKASGRAVMSRVIMTVEGFPAVDIEHPVYGPKGRRMGSVSLLIKPEEILGTAFSRHLKSGPYSAWAMQADGYILYDSQEKEIGRNLFRDPLYKGYPKLREVGWKISETPSGADRYDFQDPGATDGSRRYCQWATVSLHGTEWRLVLNREMKKENRPSSGLKKSE